MKTSKFLTVITVNLLSEVMKIDLDVLQLNAILRRLTKL